MRPHRDSLGGRIHAEERDVVAAGKRLEATQMQHRSIVTSPAYVEPISVGSHCGLPHLTVSIANSALAARPPRQSAVPTCVSQCVSRRLWRTHSKQRIGPLSRKCEPGRDGVRRRAKI
jgi:hypothetical protein